MTESELKMLEVNSNSKYMDNCEDEDFYKVTDVEEHCLGKRRVIDVLDNVLNSFIDSGVPQDIDDILLQIKKELGLEK